MHFKIFDVNSKTKQSVETNQHSQKANDTRTRNAPNEKKNQFFFTFEKKALACGFL